MINTNNIDFWLSHAHTHTHTLTYSHAHSHTCHKMNAYLYHIHILYKKSIICHIKVLKLYKVHVVV